MSQTTVLEDLSSRAIRKMEEKKAIENYKRRIAESHSRGIYTGTGSPMGSRKLQGRNTECFCGSGKKFKKCCGK